MAFKIIINGITADLKGASKQELVFQNPIFDYEQMTGSYGLPFSLAFSKTNDRIFNNARSEFSAGMPLNYLCEQYLNDSLVAEGLIVLTDTNGSYNCNFTSNLRDIFTPVSGSVRYDGYLRDILPAGPDVSSFALRNAMTTWNSIVCYPTMLNDQFYGASAPGGWDNFLNSYNAATYQNTTFTPFVSVKYILTQIGLYYGITFTGEFITNTSFDRLVIGTNSAEDGATTAQIKLAVGNIKVADFVNNLRALLGLTGKVDTLAKTIRLDFAKNAFNAEVTADWSLLCSKIISKNTPKYAGVGLGYKLDEADSALSKTAIYNKYQTNIISETNREITPALSPIYYNPTTKICEIQKNGKTTVNGQLSKDNGTIRVAFYLGNTSTPAGTRPIVYYTSLDNVFSLPSSGASIRRKETYFASEETFWQNTFEASFKINLRKLSLSGFDIKSKVHIHGWNYLIKRIVMDCNNPENSLLEAYRA